MYSIPRESPGAWGYVRCILLYATFTIPLAAAEILEIPYNPTWRQYVDSESQNLIAIGNAIDSLKDTISNECPIGDSDRTKAKYLRSLFFPYFTLESAEGKFTQAVKGARGGKYSMDDGNIMDIQGAGSQARGELLELQKYSAANLEEVEELYKGFEKYFKLTRDAVVNTIALGRSLSGLPGLTDPQVQQDWDILNNIAQRINFARTDDNGSILLDSDKTPQLFVKKLRDAYVFLENAEIDARKAAQWSLLHMIDPDLLSLIQGADLTYGAGSDTFTYGDLYKMIAEWFSCWQPEIANLIFAMENHLGQAPELGLFHS
ncbi:hypothetical protein H072_11426 [Dactylellina haptotyla CBS 200.50]|uniref:Uncharacterized protein n=1 Tax=Dactylellina haptotyla (strain CBS 200.50) TaxID=1284197 RepID=S8B889_DACHA|nr:hypothetical protein H072_11426 [Dactylellina haptotyla CBS 200.50]